MYRLLLVGWQVLLCSTLREVVEDGDESPQFRISAARSILEYSLKLTEQNDIIATLQELEAEVKKERR